jgi:GTP-binding protein
MRHAFGSALNAEFLKSASGARDFPPDVGAEVAVVGRSNSGKSSAINAILGSRKLARVSKTPGRTQLINFFGLGEDRRCVDLPGYGYAQVAANVRSGWERLVVSYFESRQSLRGLLLTVDIRRGILELDERMLLWCEQLSVPVCILATKCDKLSRNKARQATAAMSAAAAGRAVRVCPFSSLDGTGVEEVRAQLTNWLQTDA